MAPRLTAQQRREKAAEAYKMHVRRVTKTEIAKTLDLSRPTVIALIKEEQDRLLDDRAKEDERVKAIASHEAVVCYGWEMLTGGNLKENSLNQAGILNSIISAQKAIDDITGVKAASRHEHSGKDGGPIPLSVVDKILKDADEAG